MSLRRELIDAVASGADLDAVLAMATDTFGDRCWVLSPTGWAAAPGAVPGRAQRRTLIRHVLAEHQLPTTVRTEDGPFVLWPVISAARPVAARWFLAIHGDYRDWNDEQRAIVVELATAVALLWARIDQARQIASRPLETTLRRLVGGDATVPEIAAGLESAGLPTGESLRVALLTLGDEQQCAATVLREIAAATGPASVTVPFRNGAAALFVADPSLLTELERRILDIANEIETGVARTEIAVGLSEISMVAGLGGALGEAGHALSLARTKPAGARVVTGTELVSHGALLASVPDDLRRSYRDRLLGRLRDYDRRHGSELIHTLRTFLECSGSWSRCAQRLHVHVNTLRYRIRRAEEITGRDLGDFAARVDFYLALQMDRQPTAK